MGVLAVTVLVTALISSSVVAALGFTTATRAGVQSQAAAEAGIAVAQASLLRGDCTTGLYESNSDLVYSVSVSYVHNGVTSVGCPPEGASEVRITAAGEAVDAGVTFSGSDESAMEALYVATSSGVPASGAAIYAYSATGFGGSGSLVSMDGSDATVHIKHGDVTCDGTSSIPDAFVVADGSLTATGSCNIGGSVWASDKITLTGSLSVGGNVVASDLKLTGSSRVGGTGWITGNSELAWSTKIMGHLTTKSFTGPNPSGSTPGGLTVVPSGPVAKPFPVVADWIDFNYDPADWPGFVEKVISGNCSFNVIQNAIIDVQERAILLDARACSGDFNISDYQTLQMKNDLVIVNNRFKLGGSARIAANGNYNLWLITTDEVENGTPDCPTGGKFEIGGTFSVDSDISALIYTPCRAQIGSGIHWYGQVFAGATTVSGSATIHFQPSGLPGWDLSTGQSSGSQPLSDLLLNPTVVRNISTGG
jgi:hypothetical protein